MCTRRPTRVADSERGLKLGLALETSSGSVLLPRPTGAEDAESEMPPLSVHESSEVLGSSPKPQLKVIN